MLAAFQQRRGFIAGARCHVLALTTICVVSAEPAGAQPTLQLGTITRYHVPDSIALTDVQQLAHDRSGQLIVLERRGLQLLVFDAGGRFEGTVGRPGAGPGEFRRISRFGWIGDTLWAVDPTFRRVTLFPPAGTEVVTFEWPVAQPRLPGMALWPEAILANRCALLVESVQPAHAEHVSGTGRFVLRACANAKDVDTLARMSYRAAWMVVPLPANRGEYQGSQPWTDTGLGAASSDGSYFAVVEPPVSSGESANRVEVRLYASDGRVVFSTQIPYRPVPLTDRLVNETLAPLVTALARQFPSASEARNAVQRAIRRPRFLPAVRDILVGRDGSVWVELSADASSRHWRVIDSAGRLSGQLQVPQELRILDATSTAIWGVELGADDVPHLLRANLRRN